MPASASKKCSVDRSNDVSAWQCLGVPYGMRWREVEGMAAPALMESVSCESTFLLFIAADRSSIAGHLEDVDSSPRMHWLDGFPDCERDRVSGFTSEEVPCREVDEVAWETLGLM